MYAFDNQRPADAAPAARAGGAADARFLAGRQSLVQAMKQHLAPPSALVDLGGIGSLAGIVRQGDPIRIGSMTRHADADQRAAPVAKRAVAQTCGATSA
ncbi:MAG: hypothetical protein RJA99_2311 [Pseudomonadota bacterium]|jgi:carbon-monoxide dehydrogenase medium subunit